MKTPTWSWQTVVLVAVLAGVGGGLCMAKMPGPGVPVLMAAVALAGVTKPKDDSDGP